MANTIDLSFINKDVSLQLTHSHHIVEAAEKLRELLPRVTDEEVKKQIENQIRTLVEAAKGLTANATATSTTAANLTSLSGKL